MVRIALFEDNKERRESLELLIRQEIDMQLVGVFEDGRSAIDNVCDCLPDVILMDIGMPKVNGIEATRIIKSSFPNIIILIQTHYEDDENLFLSLKNGASGYILKKTPPNKIIEAIRDSKNGGAPISPAMAHKMLQYFTSKNTAISVDYGISFREKQILRHLVDGCSYKMIADKEQISFHTVNSHVRKIYEKMHVHSIGEAISKALKEDLIK